MTDRRILKTKKNLKDALLELLCEKPLEKVTVKEICERARTGRVTFYTYYEDKYGLLYDCIQDLQQAVVERQQRLQEENNPENDLSRSLQNLIISIMDEAEPYNSQRRFLYGNPELMFLFYNYIMRSMDALSKTFGERLRSSYDREQLHAFLVLGFYGFIHAKPDADPQTLREDVRRLVDDLLNSPILDTRQHLS